MDALANAFNDNCRRHIQDYSPTIDKMNRWPLLERFRQENSTVPSFSTREAMWSFIAHRSPGAIDYLEFGVHQGYSILYFADQIRSTNSRFFGFDTFSGLPEDWTGSHSDYPRGHFDTGGRIPETNDSRIKFFAGLFQETLPEFLIDFKTDNKVIVNIDCDLYSSTLYCLTKLDAFLPKVTILIFDEFGEVLHEFRAASDYISSYQREVKVICSHCNCYTVAVEL